VTPPGRPSRRPPRSDPGSSPRVHRRVGPPAIGSGSSPNSKALPTRSSRRYPPDHQGGRLPCRPVHRFRLSGIRASGFRLAAQTAPMQPTPPPEKVRCGRASAAGPGNGSPQCSALSPWTGTSFPIRGVGSPEGVRGCIPTRDVCSPRSGVERSVGPFGSPSHSTPAGSEGTFVRRGPTGPGFLRNPRRILEPPVGQESRSTHREHVVKQQ